MTTGTARPVKGAQRARFNATSNTLRALTAIAAAALLASCGGSDEPTASTQALQGAEKQKAQAAFVPAGTIPTDANVAGMWSPAYNWPLISVHSAILPDGRLMTYGSDLTGLQTGHSNYDVWDSSGAPDATSVSRLLRSASG